MIGRPLSPILFTDIRALVFTGFCFTEETDHKDFKRNLNCRVPETTAVRNFPSGTSSLCSSAADAGMNLETAELRQFNKFESKI